MVSRNTRNRAFWSYMGPVLVLFVVVAAALAFWSTRHPASSTVSPAQEGATGTAGNRTPGLDTPGGFDPQPHPGSTRDELEHRGDAPHVSAPGFDYDRSTLKGIDAERSGAAAVEIKNATIDSADGTNLSVRDGDTRIAVIAPEGSTSLRPGMRVDISGTRESDGRVRASRVSVRQ